MKYNKLVRDRIPEIIKEKGEKCSYHIAEVREYREKLAEKLKEELEEMSKNPTAEEAADILEVFQAFLLEHKIPMGDVVSEKTKKLEERGGFSKRIILDES